MELMLMGAVVAMTAPLGVAAAGQKSVMAERMSGTSEVSEMSVVFLTQKYETPPSCRGRKNLWASGSPLRKRVEERTWLLLLAVQYVTCNL